MKNSELFTRVILVIIAILALFAIILQIINDKTTLLETTYEILTFSVSLIAVTLAVLQGLDNVRTTRELHKLTREVKQQISEINTLNNDDGAIINEIKNIDRKSSGKFSE